MKSVYLDHASATPVRKEVMEAMLPYFEERFGNPSTVYDLGSEVKDVVEAQRSKVAKLIGAKPGNEGKSRYYFRHRTPLCPQFCQIP
jgi:cysteine desulfurase